MLGQKKCLIIFVLLILMLSMPVIAKENEEVYVVSPCYISKIVKKNGVMTITADGFGKQKEQEIVATNKKEIKYKISNDVKYKVYDYDEVERDSTSYKRIKQYVDKMYTEYHSSPNPFDADALIMIIIKNNRITELSIKDL